MRTRLALSLAAVTVVCACGQPPALRVEGPAPAPPATRPAPAPPSLSPDNLKNIRTVDLRSTLLTDPLVVEEVKKALRDCAGDLCGLQDPKYADLTQHGRDDVIVSVRRDESEGIYAAYAYSVQKGRLQQVFGVVGHDVSLEPDPGNMGDLLMTRPLYRAGAQQDVPAAEEVVEYRWDGERFVELKRTGGKPGLVPYRGN